MSLSCAAAGSLLLRSTLLYFTSREWQRVVEPRAAVVQHAGRWPFHLELEQL
jgi:hypothetical protein